MIERRGKYLIMIMANKDKKKTGAVLVQGGGIAGVQASLDLANSGFKVYLVERSAAIGGMMAHLDKTFPTGDCATCIVSPKLVECARNLNVEILTNSELISLEGEPGNFTAKVKTAASIVDKDKCNACGDCSPVCPVEIKDQFDRGLGTRKAIAKRYAQAVPNVYEIKNNGHAPCKRTCPANINVQGYVQLIKKKEYIKAVDLIRQRNPLSAICGRICTHPCESECRRGEVDSPVAIRLLKRFASDKEMEMIKSGELSLPEEKTPAADAQKVAVIGAGPAGLTTANDLADRGFAVTVYEALPAAGGMLRCGIPEYRLPYDVLDHEIELIRRKGVTFVMNCRVGKDISFEDIRKENESVFVSVGVHMSRSLGIEGEDKTGVIQGVEFLRQAGSLDNRPEVKGRVVVIGGGNVAIDVARTALRLGAESVDLVSLEHRNEMPAYEEEVVATLDEGINLRNGWGPRQILGSDTVSGIELKRCTSVFGYDGRFNPVFSENDRTIIEADQIYIAIGQKNDDQLLDHLGLSTERGSIQADSTTLATSIDGVFAGGDTVSGPASVIEAVAAGKRAADSIEMYLKGEDINVRAFDDSIRMIPEELLPSTDDVEKQQRAESEELPVSKREGNFDEVEIGCSEEVALAEAERCLNCALCSECGECKEACSHKAIDYNACEQINEIEVGSVIMTPGFEEFDARTKGEFGFGRYANVMTSVQFERMLSAAGPFAGHVVRPSDEKPANRVAWIQCVGSRDSSCGNDYCSSVCCMASTKQAMIARDHSSDLKATIFYMDIRAHGKDFDKYYERACGDEKINYIKSMPSRVIQVPGSNDLRMRFISDSGEISEQDFDIVVLSVGMEPVEAVKQIATKIGIDLNEFGFCATDRFAPLETSREGVFVAGAFQEPKDIPETVTQASGAASKAMELLAKSRNTLVTKKKYPAEHDITDEEPRIGVFVCHCGVNIASVIDVEKVTNAAAELKDVILATNTMFTCSDDSLSNIRDMIHEHKLNRVVVASCTPRTHGPLFSETLREAGLNPYMFELANIRDQCSWVHSNEPEAATEKAIDLMKMSVARSRLLSPLEGSSLTVNQTGLIVGGGLSGMTAALALADQGFMVNLVEKENSLGGHLSNIYSTLEGQDVAGFTANIIERTEGHRNINVHLASVITHIAGHIGKFNTTIAKDGNSIDIISGAIIVATGGWQARTSEYLHGKNDAVMNQVELEKRIAEKTFAANGKNIVMIQCVGSRNEEHAYCSRICCSMAVKNALNIKKQNPDANIYVLYRDIRTYGFREVYYKQARQAGVVFVRYETGNLPVVSEKGNLTVTLNSPDLADQIVIEADNVILSTGVEACSGNKELSDMLKVPINADGFYVEAHMKLRPVEFATEGVYLCGLAHSPKMIDENISQAKAAASRAATVLSKQQLDVSAQVSVVDQDKCISCMTCVKVCPYSAPDCNVDGKGQIEAAKCMGCGICVSECPAKAIQLNNFVTTQFKAMIEELFAGK